MIRDVRFTPKADMSGIEIDVRFVTLADITASRRLDGTLRLRCGFASGHLAPLRIEAHGHPPHIAPKIVVSLGCNAKRRFE
jgi:hypothetical protein